MTEEEWAYFIASGNPQIARLTRLPQSLCEVIGCSVRAVTIHHFYAIKCERRLSTYELPLIRSPLT
jgi:hypothetical protein